MHFGLVIMEVRSIFKVGFNARDDYIASRIINFVIIIERIDIRVH